MLLRWLGVFVALGTSDAKFVPVRRPERISHGLRLGITMSAFGYAIRPTNDPGPYEISEVTFDVPFAQLRRIADFLKNAQIAANPASGGLAISTSRRRFESNWVST